MIQAKIKTVDQVVKLLQRIDPMPNPRIYKAKTLYELAKQSTASILELGSFRGIGTISLCYGAQAGNNVKVHTIDAFGGNIPDRFRDFYNAHYSRADYEVFQDNIRKAKVSPIIYIGWFRGCAKVWIEPLSLLVWDASTLNMLEDVLLWKDHIVPGGVIAIHYVPQRKKKNEKDYMSLATAGFKNMGELPGGFVVFEKGKWRE